MRFDEEWAVEVGSRSVSLVGGPVGRRILWEILDEGFASLRDGDVSDLGRGAGSLPDHVRAVVSEGLDPATELARSTDDSVLNLMGRVVSNFAHGDLMDDRALLDGLEAAADALAPLADSLAESPANSWWWDSVGEVQLVAAGCSGFGVVDERSLSAWPARWWSAPTGPQIVHTSRPSLCGVPVGLVLSEDHWVPVEPPGWSSFAPQDDRVYEVRCAEDWQQLVATYPTPRTGASASEWDRFAGGEHTWLDVDWLALSDDLPGVHVSVAAHLSSAYRPLPLAGGRFTMLAGWNPDVTVWLHESSSSIPPKVYEA